MSITNVDGLRDWFKAWRVFEDGYDPHCHCFDFLKQVIEEVIVPCRRVNKRFMKMGFRPSRKNQIDLSFSMNLSILTGDTEFPVCIDEQWFCIRPDLTASSKVA
jgi:hypothetical protein